MQKGTVFDIKEMAVHDGPGIRTTVFFKGCPLKCIWCHNPEGLKAEPQLMYKEQRCIKCDACKTDCSHSECKPFGRCIHMCPCNCLSVSGKTYTTAEIIEILSEYKKTMGDTFGGVTFSGGEPLFQPDFLYDLIVNAREIGIHTCIETSGFASEEIFKKIVDALDFVIMDIKLIDDALHKKYTGVSNKQILKNFEYLKSSGKPYIVRTPLIPKITDTPENLMAIKKIIGDSSWEQLPYNSVAGAKYKMLGLEFEMEK